MQNTPIVRTRMAPSPTGEYHVGHLATLLKNYAFARKHSGQFVLRIEDTDQARKVDGAAGKIMQVIRSYGLDWDEGPDKGGEYGPYVQSQRLDLYKKYARQLIDADKAYYCFCSRERLDEVRSQQRKDKKPPKYDKHCRNLDLSQSQEKIKKGAEHVVRLKIPDSQPISYQDLMRGQITVNSDDIDDQVLVKSDGFPTYHLAVVVDDHLMKITHIMRGEEWLSSTPKHILLYEAFGWQLPIYAHIPVFLNPDGKGKMSKRKGTVSAQSFLDKGYLPEALLNFFMILGWAPKDGEEVMTLDRYIKEFEPKDMSAKSVVFDLKKLDWINGVYIRSLLDDELKKRLTPFLPADFPQDKISSILELVKERLVKLGDIESLTSFFYRDLDWEEAKPLLEKNTKKISPEFLVNIKTILDKLSDWSVESLESTTRGLQEKNDWHKKSFFMTLRVAVTGRKATPPLFETMHVLGKEKTLNRLKTAHSILS